MRHRRVEATAGIVNARALSSRRLLVRGGAVLVAAWIALAFAQEAWTAHRLAAQAADLGRRNAAIAAQNQEYRRDIATVNSGAAAEEVARSNGYSKPDEKVFVVASPAAPAAGGSGSSTAAPGVDVKQASPSFGDAVRGWWEAVARRL